MADAVAAGMQPPLGTEARACVPLLNADVRTDIQWACYPGDYRSVKVYRLAITMALTRQKICFGGFRGVVIGLREQGVAPTRISQSGSKLLICDVRRGRGDFAPDLLIRGRSVEWVEAFVKKVICLYCALWRDGIQ